MKLGYKILGYDKNLSTVLYPITHCFIFRNLLFFLLVTFLCFGYNATDQKKIPPSEDQITCLSLKVLINEVKNHPDNREAQSFARIGRLNGYVVDRDEHDIILFGEHAELATALTLDDFVVNVRNIWNRESYPYCSLDPLPENILKLNKLINRYHRASSVEEMKNNFSKLREAIGQQSVVTGGVPRNSRHAHTMIDADYHMKKVSQGLVKLNNVRSCIDITIDKAKDEINNTGNLQPTGLSMSRFWFHIADGEPIYLQGDGILYLDKCSVVILTERQRATVDGELYDSNEDDPTAETFAQELSDHFREATLVEPSYANLENLYRLQALLRAIHYRNDIETSGLDIDFLLRGYQYRNESGMPPSLLGLANYAKETIELKVDNGVYTYTLFPIVCGGVSMEMICKKSQFDNADKNKADEIKRIILDSRPSSASLCWKVKNEL